MAKKKKANRPLRWIIALTVIFCAAAVGSMVLTKTLSDQRTARLEAAREEVAAINEQRDQEYSAALADFEAQQQAANGGNLAWPDHKMEGYDLLDLTHYPLESPTTVSVTRQEIMNKGLLLVNQWHSRPEDFSEEEIQKVGNYTKWAIQVTDGSVRLFPVAIDAYVRALNDAKALGYENYMIQEGYRTWDEQNELYQAALARYQERYSGDALIARALRDVNYPGTSEYNTGLAFNVRLYKKGDTEVNNAVFNESDEGIWLCENAWKYGLVFRFQRTDWPLKGSTDKSYKTGVSSKLRCFRYVGEGNAAIMHAMDWCLEEYIEYLIQHPHIALFEDGVLKYEIYRQPVGDATSFDVQLTRNARSWSTSLDNMGAVITVFEY